MTYDPLFANLAYIFVGLSVLLFALMAWSISRSETIRNYTNSKDKEQ